MKLPFDDAWKTAAADDVSEGVGVEDGQPCNRVPEPDEDAPRGHRPTRCDGTMTLPPVENCSCHISPPCGACVDNVAVCDVCGESA